MQKWLKNSRWLQVLTKAQTYLLYAMPVVIFFSYHPVILLGSSQTMNYELSLPLIWLLLFALLGLPTLPRAIKSFHAKAWQISLLALFPAYLLLSLIWTSNLTRGVLTSGIVVCLIISILNFPRLIKSQAQKARLLRIFLTASALVAGFCWVQSILDIAGFPTTHTLACQGCTTNMFGFPHPNGFAIEPQFMGNLLLAPTLLSLYLILHASSTRHQRAKLLALTVFLATTLFFTFSRGAIYAFLLACAFIIVAELITHHRSSQAKKSTRPISLLIIPIVLSSLLLSLSLQGCFAALSPTSDDFWSGLTKSLHQLTLGQLDLRPSQTVPDDNSPATTPDVVENTISGTAASDDASTTSAFDGYVAESTNIRISLTRIALNTWRQTPASLLFGVGVGGSGVAMYQAHPELGSVKEITQNQYTEILLEFGLFGTSLLLLATIFIIKKVSPLHPYATALLLAYAFTLLFFSGLPNALHLYLLPPLFLNQKPTAHKL